MYLKRNEIIYNTQIYIELYSKLFMFYTLKLICDNKFKINGYIL